jgi:hypothetical protein
VERSAFSVLSRMRERRRALRCGIWLQGRFQFNCSITRAGLQRIGHKCHFAPELPARSQDAVTVPCLPPSCFSFLHVPLPIKTVGALSRSHRECAPITGPDADAQKSRERLLNRERQTTLCSPHPSPSISRPLPSPSDREATTAPSSLTNH